MIRQAINCDICGAEKQASNYWFVAYEQGAELKLRGWESPQNSRKNVKHLCGQKCAQRLMANFMASLMSVTHGAEQGKEGSAEAIEAIEPHCEVELVAIPEKTERASPRMSEATDRSLLNGSPTQRPVAEGEWVGPVRFKEDAWERPAKVRIEHEPFVNASRTRISGRSQRLV